MAATSKRRLKHNDYRVAIICPLVVEMNAVRYMLDEEHGELPVKDGDPNKYIFGRMSELNVVIGYLPQGSQGIGAAATVATHMKRSFPSAKLRLLVGIGGGIPSTTHDIRLGDVAVSMPDLVHGGVVQYDLGKETSTGFVRKGHLDKPPQEWRNAVVKMQSDHWVAANKIPTFVSALRSKSVKLSEYYQCPGAESDIRSSASTTHPPGQSACDKCEEASPVIKSARASQEPEIFYGAIASGDRVIKTAEKRDSISRDVGGALCFEMEAAGLMNDFHCVVIRGIADYADAHKNDTWHGYAAAAAAGCAKELLAYMKPVAEPKITKNSTIPKLRVQTFVGRKTQISAIKAYFANTAGAIEPRILILSAMGGQGKSQIALEYCRQTKEDYHGMFWVDASSRSTTIRSFGAIADVLGEDAGGLVNDNEKVQFVLRILENPDDRWLVVFDNYDSPADFKDVQSFLPTAGAAHLLFTSRYKDLTRLGKVLTIPPLLATEEVWLLLRGFERHEIDEHETTAKHIVERLGHLALAIDQAASYIRFRRLKIEQLSQFLEAYELEREKILKHVPNDFWGYGFSSEPEGAAATSLSAFTTWEMSLQQLCHHMPDCQEDVAHFFSISAFLAPIPVDDWIFRNHWEMRKKPSDWMQIFFNQDDRTDGINRTHESVEKPSGAHRQAVDVEQCDDEQYKSKWNHDNYWQLVERADSYSLVQNASAEWATSEKNVKFVLHPLIRDWLQLRQHPEQRQRLTKETIAILIDSITAINVEANTLASVKQTLLLHLNASLRNDKIFTKEGRRLGQRLNSCHYASRFADFYCDQGLYDRQFELCEKIYNTKAAQLGRSYEDTMDAASCLGNVLLFRGKYSEAEQRLRETLSLQQEILDHKHEDILRTKTSLAQLFLAQAKYEEAERLIREVLKIEEELFDKTDSGRHATMAYLSRALRDQGKHQEAEAILRDVHSLCEGLYGARDLRTMDIRRELARILLRQGQVQEAQIIIRGVLDTTVRIQGPDHSGTLAAKHDLALTLERQGNYADARSLFEDALESYRKLYGMYHPYVLTTRHNLARLLKHQGEYEKSEAILRDVFLTREQVLGADHKQTLATARDLAFTVSKQGKHAEAERIYRDTLVVKSRVLGMNRSTFETMKALGGLLAYQHRYVEARELLEDALSGYIQVFGPDSKRTGRCQKKLAWVLEKMADSGFESEMVERKYATSSLERQDTNGSNEADVSVGDHTSNGKVPKSQTPASDHPESQDEHLESRPTRLSRRKELLRKLPFARKRINNL